MWKTDITVVKAEMFLCVYFMTKREQNPQIIQPKELYAI